MNADEEWVQAIQSKIARIGEGLVSMTPAQLNHARDELRRAEDRLDFIIDRMEDES